MRLWSLAAAALVATPAIAQQQIVKIDGSSTVFPVTEAVAEDFQKAKRQQVKVTVGISGTGGGFKKFCRGETDISNASRPILKAEMADCAKTGVEYFELPVAFEKPSPDLLERDFTAAYRALYGYDDDSGIELVRLRLVARGLRDKRLDFAEVRFEELPSAMHQDSRAVAAQRGHAPVTMPVIARAALGETPRPGPFIVEEFDATIVVPAGARARRDAAGTVHIEVGASDEG